MPRRRPSLESVKGKLEGRMLNRFPYCVLFISTKEKRENFWRLTEGRHDVPEGNVAVHSKRHRVHEFGRVGH